LTFSHNLCTLLDSERAYGSLDLFERDTEMSDKKVPEHIKRERIAEVYAKLA
jgi:hypothetical protein